MYYVIHHVNSVHLGGNSVATTRITVEQKASRLFALFVHITTMVAKGSALVASHLCNYAPCTLYYTLI